MNRAKRQTPERLILFAREPRLGAVKTRLVPPLSVDQALLVYEAFLADQLDFLRSLSRPARSVEVCCDGPCEPGARAGLPVTAQGNGDLGARMLRAALRAQGEGALATVFIGVDSPTLPASHVERAFELLRDGTVDAAVSPAEDGGYVLLGLSAPHPALFKSIAWGTSEVLETTKTRAREAGLSLGIIDSWYDVDEIEALRRLRTEVGSRPDRAPRTARCLTTLPTML